MIHDCSLCYNNYSLTIASPGEVASLQVSLLHHKGRKGGDSLIRSVRNRGAGEPIVVDYGEVDHRFIPINADTCFNSDVHRCVVVKEGIPGKPAEKRGGAVNKPTLYHYN